MSLQNLNEQRSAVMNTLGAALGITLSSLGILVGYLSDNLLFKYICICFCVLGLIVSILLIVFFWLDLRLKELVLSIISKAPVIETHKEELTPTMSQDLIIVLRYNGRQIDNMYQYILKLHNTGHKALEEKDYNEQSIAIKFSAKVLGAKILEPDHKNALKLLSIEEEKVYIKPFMLKGHEWITLRVFVDRIVEGGVGFDDSISDSELGFRVKKAEESYSKNLRISRILRVLRFGIILTLCAASIAIFIFIEKNYSGQFLFAFLIILTIAFFYLVISGIITSVVSTLIGRNAP